MQGLISAKITGEAHGLQQILQQNDISSRRLKSVLEQCQINHHSLQAIYAFNADSPMMAEVSFTSQAPCWLIAVVPAHDMATDSQDVASDIILYVRRKNPGEKPTMLSPPDPLFDPKQDINIQPGNAVAYEVRAGDYIQILDVQGRECSDFQAFALRDLDKNIISEIDPTTTRSLMGTLYPTPGIFSKYFANNQTALVEIVQDTCGRHDTFGLACTARYYDDLGYPGHVNCTDNINKSLAKYNIAERQGWPAINFFFNTLLDDTQALSLDDPWSRPGDYVMLRALTDLLCVSTACPCDVDAANGWNPTDIQVRTYDKENTVKKSIGWRKMADGEMIETKETGFHNCFKRFTENFIDYNGYWLAANMANYGAIAEYWACREKVIITDLSPLRKYEITGPDAQTLLQLCVTRNIEKLSVGQVVYTAICYEHGGMIDDGTVFRLGDTNFRWIGGNDDSGLWMQKQALEHGLNAWVRPSTDELCNVAVQGQAITRDFKRDFLDTAHPKQHR